jgi:hypothetical protein
VVLEGLADLAVKSLRGTAEIAQIEVERRIAAHEADVGANVDGHNPHLLVARI